MPLAHPVARALRRTRMAALGLSGLLLAVPQAQTAEVGGLKFEDRVQIGGQELVLNGAGVRTRLVLKVYALALYLPAPQATPAQVLASAGARRFSLGLLREITGEELGQAFLAGVRANSQAGERARYAEQLTQLGEHFASAPPGKRGDFIHVDWLPDAGTVISVHGRVLGAPLKDLGFYNMLLKIWLGNQPVDPVLKSALLGAQ